MGTGEGQGTVPVAEGVIGGEVLHGFSAYFIGKEGFLKREGSGGGKS